MNRPKAPFLTTTVAIVCFIGCSISLAKFRPMYHVAAEIGRPELLSVADMDNDGNLDVLVSSGEEDRMGWLMNDGTGQFGPFQEMAPTYKGVNRTVIGDLDGDGDMDVLVWAVNDGGYPGVPSSVISWYANDGTDGFGPSRKVATEAWEIRSVDVADLDRDGDLDILYSGYAPQRVYRPGDDSAPGYELIPESVICWLANDGTGGFTPGPTVTLDAIELQFLCLADLDGDENTDLLAVMNDYEIAWFPNEGQGRFDMWQTVSVAAAQVNHVCAADLNGDGALDVMAGFDYDRDPDRNHPAMGWYANGGNGEFDLLREIPTGIDAFYKTWRTAAFDVDRDGDLDVVAIHYACAQICKFPMAWYANDGSGQFSFRQIIGWTDYGSLSQLLAADLDNDGDLDLLAVDQREEQVQWFENGGLGYGPQLVISREMERPQAVEAADLNGDGLADVLSLGGREDTLVWQENRGSLSFGPQQLIHEWPSDSRSETSFFAADLDTDGDVDLVSSFFAPSFSALEDSDFVINWHENDGTDRFGLQPVSRPGDHYATRLAAADLDGDGRLDVLGAGHHLTWYANRDAGNFGPMQIIGRAEYYSLLTADLDGDGDTDVITRLNWYANDGTGQFGERRVISTDTEGLNAIHVADLDGDGDSDVLCAAFLYYPNTDPICYVGWYVNDGTGQFGPRQPISSDLWETNSLCAADLDDDGDQDVLTASYHVDTLAWHENQGNGLFGDRQVIYNRADGVCCIDTADLNGNGRVDILSASDRDNTIALYDND